MDIMITLLPALHVLLVTLPLLLLALHILIVVLANLLFPIDLIGILGAIATLISRLIWVDTIDIFILCILLSLFVDLRIWQSPLNRLHPVNEMSTLCGELIVANHHVQISLHILLHQSVLGSTVLSANRHRGACLS